MIFCIMFSGSSLSKMASDILFKTAQKMVKQDKRRMSVHHDDCMGVVTTDFESVQFNGLSGCRFEAEIATPRGDTKVDFLVRLQDLEIVDEVNWIHAKIKIKPKKKKSEAHRWN